MRILSVHNSYLLAGGEDRSWELQNRLLTQHGHSVKIYHEHNRRIKEIGVINAAARTLWSRESYRKIRDILLVANVDIVHCENTFPLISPAIYYAAQSLNVPIVQSLRNYRLSCLNAYFYREDSICEDCLGRPFALPGVIHRCYKGSTLASATVATMLAMHWKLKTYQQKVNKFIALTEFAKQKYVEIGIPEDKIAIKPNFVYPDPGIGKGDGGFALFVGRLSEEKGLHTLIAAWKRLGHKLKLKIVGDGPLRSLVENAQKESGSIEYMGSQPAEIVYKIMGEAHVLMFPSRWYEGMPRVILEAYAKGTPVIASNVGAMTSLVAHGYTGLHFKISDEQDLVRQVNISMSDEKKWEKMRRHARRKFEQAFEAESNYQALMRIYSDVLDHAQD